MYPMKSPQGSYYAIRSSYKELLYYSNLSLDSIKVKILPRSAIYSFRHFTVTSSWVIYIIFGFEKFIFSKGSLKIYFYVRL